MILFYLLLFVFTPSDTTYVEKTEQQVSEYVSNLKEGRKKSLNSWAIHEIASQNCEGLNIVKFYIQDIPIQSDFYREKSCENLAEFSNNPNGISFWDETVATL